MIDWIDWISLSVKTNNADGLSLTWTRLLCQGLRWSTWPASSNRLVPLFCLVCLACRLIHCFAHLSPESMNDIAPSDKALSSMPNQPDTYLPESPMSNYTTYFSWGGLPEADCITTKNMFKNNSLGMKSIRRREWKTNISWFCRMNALWKRELIRRLYGPLEVYM